MTPHSHKHSQIKIQKEKAQQSCSQPPGEAGGESLVRLPDSSEWPFPSTVLSQGKGTAQLVTPEVDSCVHLSSDVGFQASVGLPASVQPA